MLDFLAKRYSKLPSEVLESGLSIDLYVAELAVGYESYLAEKSKNGETLNSNKGYSTQELTQMLENVRKHHGTKNEG